MNSAELALESVFAQRYQEREARWQGRLERERRARKQAERMLEDKSLDLFLVNKELRRLAESLEKKVEERTAQLSDALHSAEAAAIAKTEFLATMSHEIRTPMNGVIGMADLLLSTVLTEEQLHYLNVLKGSSHTLLALINDILDFSKIEAGKLALEKIACDPRTLLQEIESAFLPQIEDKGLVLQLEIDTSVPECLIIDPTRLKQVLFNLVSNAIKFTDKGGVTVVLRAGQQPNEWLVSVTDTGIGISQVAQQRLFSAFTQADSSITRQYGGTGLGLAISQKLVQLMSGILSVESEPGVGSCFQFKFIAQEVSAEVVKAQEQADESSLLTDLRVLLVEDNLVNQMLALKFLEKMGVSADLAKEGEEATRKVQENNYDIVLMDMQMPVMDGITATRVIRGLGAQIHQPKILALTANAFKDDREACFAAGMDCFLSKPIRYEVLLRALLKHQQSV